VLLRSKIIPMKRIERNKFIEETRLRDESLFNCAAGKLGIRGCFEEGVPVDKVSIRGAYLNGFADTEVIQYNEKLFGFPEIKQTMVNLPDAQGIELLVNNEKLTCYSDNASDFLHSLNMEEGITNREFVCDTKNGKIKLEFERLVSFNRPGLFVIKAKATSITFNGKVTIKSLLNGDVKNFTSTNDPRVSSGSGKMTHCIFAENKDGVSRVEIETNNSKRKALVEVKTNVYKKENINLNYEKQDALLIASCDADFKENEEIIIEKYCYYQESTTSKDSSIFSKAVKDGYEIIKNEQKKFMDNFWESSRVLIDCDEIKQENIDFCLYELLCSSGRDGLTSAAAKGLSGEGYEGHYFWDCETYIYPFFLNTDKEEAKALLNYRYSKLDEARKHARAMGHKKGALYPWRTITGSECSSYYPSGSAQYHINGDIARAFIEYWNMTEDYSYLSQICEVLLETSRLWIDAGHYDNGEFKIDCVTGPDEYTCVVNNNYYTNIGAANNLFYAAKLIRILSETKEFANFKKKTNLDMNELDEFEEASKKMYLPYDEELGIIKQDDSFLNKKKVDLNTIPKENFPLLLHYHPLYINRFQVCKQADAVLADYLFANLDSSTSMRTFKYYEACTTHDSSLSKCIFGIVAAKLGNLDEAKEYFLETLSTDIDDEKGNTKDGLHMANMGGCYLMVTTGFAGLKVNGDNLSLFPMLPKGIRSYGFPIEYKGVHLYINVDNKGTTISIKESIDKPLNITVYGEQQEIVNKETFIPRKSKAVIFDLDGVITDTAIYHYEAWKKIADELNAPFDEVKNEQFKGVSRSKCLELLLTWGNIKVTDEEFNNLLVRKNDYYKDLLNNLTPNSILRGIVDTLAELKKNGIKTALFSVSKNTDAILAKLNLQNSFDVIVTGNDVKHSKPNYDGYLLAADRMGVDPRLCIMVEDSVAGISGAKALSMKTLAIMKENAANADYCIPSTSELKIIEDCIKNSCF